MSQTIKRVAPNALAASVALLLGSIVPAAAADLLPNPSLSTRSGDVALARYVTANSEHLMHAEGLFAQETEAVGDIPGGVR